MAIKAIEVGRAPRLYYLRPGAALDNQTPLRPRRAYNGPAHYVRGAIVVPPPPPSRPRARRPPSARRPPRVRAIVLRSEIERAIVLKSEIERPIVLGHAPIVRGPIVVKSQTSRPIVLGSFVVRHYYYNYSCLESSPNVWGSSPSPTRSRLDRVLLEPIQGLASPHLWPQYGDVPI